MLIAACLIVGCESPTVQVGSPTEPAVRVEPISLQVASGAVQIGPATQPAVAIESGAVVVSVTTPEIPERPLWVGIAVAGTLALIAYPLQRWIRRRLWPQEKGC